MLRYNNDSGTITAYLRDNRDMSTDEVVEQWETEMADLDNCTGDSGGILVHELHEQEPGI